MLKNENDRRIFYLAFSIGKRIKHVMVEWQHTICISSGFQKTMQKRWWMGRIPERHTMIIRMEYGSIPKAINLSTRMVMKLRRVN